MDYQVIIIGSGPGGYICAIRCAQLGFKVAIVERYSTLGGTCLNVGCIPSKAWLDSSEHYFKMRHEFDQHGIMVNDAALDIGKMEERVAKVVSQNNKGVEFLMKKNKIDVHTGHATFKDKNTITIKGEEGEKTLSAEKFVIATGSKPTSLPFITIDKERIITSTEALKLKEVPQHMLVIGGGIIGLEMGSVFARLGAKVSVIEYMDSLIAGMDGSIGKELQRILKRDLKMEFYMSHQVTAVNREGDKVTVQAKDRKKDKDISLEGDYCLVSVGRRPYTDNLGLENIGVQPDERGRIPVDDHLRTSAENIFAIGDVIKGAMLAHKAEEEGVFVAETMAGQKPHINYLLIPSVVYTWPEGAGVGYTEEQLKEQGREYKSGSFSLKALGRAVASNDTSGFVKVLADKETDEILGVHMLGARMSDLVAEAVVAMEYRASAEDIGRISHAHPTFAEAMRDACLAASDNRALNA